MVADPCAHVRAAGRPGRCCRGVGLWVAYGQQGGRTLGEALLEADKDRFGAVEAVGVDETLFWRQGRWRTKQWCTSVVDVGGRQLSDIVGGRTTDSDAAWFRAQPTEWLAGVSWAVLEMSGAYHVAYDRVLPHARQPVPRGAPR